MKDTTTQDPWTKLEELLKNCVYRDVMSGRCVIDTPKQFAEHPDKAVKSITSLYLPAEDVLIELDDIEASLRIEGTFEIH